MRRWVWGLVEEVSFLPFMFWGIIEFAFTGRDDRMRRVRCRLLNRVMRARGVPDQGGCYCGRCGTPWPR